LTFYIVLVKLPDNMKKFTKDIAEVAQFIEDNPTLAHQRRALGANGRLANVELVDDWIGEKLALAGSLFLDLIHTEIPHLDEEDDAITTESAVVIKVDADGKPELTADYLRSIGKESYIEWGTE
jgi:hypothetical protein